MTPPTLTIAGTTVELTDDGTGLAGVVVIDGQRVRIHCTLTPASPRATTPAKCRWSVAR